MANAGYVQATFTVPSGVTASVTTNSGGPTVVTVTAGTYGTIDDFTNQLQADLTNGRPVTAGAWTVAVSNTGSSPTGKCTIGVTVGTFSITWIDADLESLLGFDANISGATSATGVGCVRGQWFPDSAIAPELNYQSAPPVTDMRQARTPTGRVFTHVGNARYESAVIWGFVPQNKVWYDEEVTAGESLEQFLVDAQWNISTAGMTAHPWFTAGSKCYITGHDGSPVGAHIAGWYLADCASVKQIATRVTQGWDGGWRVAITLHSDS